MVLEAQAGVLGLEPGSLDRGRRGTGLAVVRGGAGDGHVDVVVGDVPIRDGVSACGGARRVALGEAEVVQNGVGPADEDVPAGPADENVTATSAVERVV